MAPADTSGLAGRASWNRPVSQTRREWLIGVGGALALLPGCAGRGSSNGTLRVATDWSEAELEGYGDLVEGVHLEFIRPAPGIDSTRALAWGGGTDLLLGGPISRYERMHAKGLFARSESARPWRVCRVSHLGLTYRGSNAEAVPRPDPIRWTDFSDSEWSGRLVLANPVGDGPLWATVVAHLNRGDWAAGYGDLVRLAAAAWCIQPSSLAAAARVAHGRGRPDVALATDQIARAHQLPFLLVEEAAPYFEGIAILPTAETNPHAWSVLQAVAERFPISDHGSSYGHSPPDSDKEDERVESLLSDLLEATMVSAHPELRQAHEVLARPELADRLERDRAAYWLAQPPPWPPASVRGLANKSGGTALVRSLAEQVARDLRARAWLIESWNRPEEAVDDTLLRALSSAADGRLIAEPRFRAWLRAEWTAWARQRYRRVIRVAEGRVRA